MRFPPGTQVWVKCDDGVWWPGVLRETDGEMQHFLCGGEDCCVEFYHSPAELYPLVSTDAAHVQPLHAEPHARSLDEDTWFADAVVAEAVAAALCDYERRRISHTAPATPPEAVRAPALPGRAESEREALSFSASELRNINALLGAVRGPTATRLRQELQEAAAPAAPPAASRREAASARTRKRHRPGEPPARAAPPQKARRTAAGATPCPAPAPRSAVPTASTGPPSMASGPVSSPSGADADERAERRPVDGGGERAGGGGPTIPFVPAVRHRVLEVLRREVFEDRSKLVLSPVYRLLEILGAVVVENANLSTTLPAPHALRNRPVGGYSPQWRVLLVPLSEDYDHTTGWMVPVEVDGAPLSMSLYVNSTPVSLPPSWQLSPAKEAAAVKSAIAVDITPHVLPAEPELFSLQVIFSGNVAEMEMWRGIITCVLVEEVELARLGERIVATYHAPPHPALRRSPPPSTSRGDRGGVSLTEASVRLRCPVTTLVMEIPVRGVHCEHLQCMELAAALMQCARQNVWNCPLCFAAMRPEDIVVNYRLREWIATHSPTTVARVEYVVETEPGVPLKVVYKAAPVERQSAIEVVDDEDDR
ncbi:lorien protein [Novymonas esmeraldas]|uniref:Lorien protein n=1 Tax=Novymonas esmeraldas TaxID=1808958 RepID=A0AAW0EP15_9TRYP